MKMKHVIVITIFMLFSIALLSSEVLGDEYVASLSVSFSSNGDILSVGFSSTDPNSTSGITPISTINLTSDLGFDSSGKMTIVGKAVFYPYWQIQKNAPYKITISRDEKLIGSNCELTYSAILNDSKNSIVPSSGEMTLYKYESSDYNNLVKGSIGVSVETANASSLPYGTSLSGKVTLKVEAL